MVQIGEYLEKSPMWDTVGPYMKSMNAVMRSQVEQNQKLEGNVINATSGLILQVLLMELCLSIFSHLFSISEIAGKNSTMMNLMRFVVNYSPEIAQATTTMMQNYTMVTIFTPHKPLLETQSKAVAGGGGGEGTKQ